MKKLFYLVAGKMMVLSLLFNVAAQAAETNPDKKGKNENERRTETTVEQNAVEALSPFWYVYDGNGYNNPNAYTKFEGDLEELCEGETEICAILLLPDAVDDQHPDANDLSDAQGAIGDALDGDYSPSQIRMVDLP